MVCSVQQLKPADLPLPKQPALPVNSLARIDFNQIDSKGCSSIVDWPLTCLIWWVLNPCAAMRHFQELANANLAQVRASVMRVLLTLETRHSIPTDLWFAIRMSKYCCSRQRQGQMAPFSGEPGVLGLSLASSARLLFAISPFHL